MTTTRRWRRAWTGALLIGPLALSGCGTEKMNETEGRGGTRVNNAAPQTTQPDIGAGREVDAIKKEAGAAGKEAANSSTPYGGSGAGVAPPASPAPGSAPSGDTNSGQTSNDKVGPGSDATTEGAKPAPGATGPGTGTPPR